MKYKFKRIVIKVGSNVLTSAEGLPDLNRIRSLCAQIARLRREHNMEVILVSSGAVAAGRSIIALRDKLDPIARRQILSSVGQIKLISLYADFFKDQRIDCAQMLVTREDFRDRKHYLNMKNCFGALLENDIIPIVNENDVISVTELMFTDNDELAALISSMIQADALFILSNIKGIYNGDPDSPSSEIIREIRSDDNNIYSFISTRKSEFGRGGMLTKVSMAQKLARLGSAVFIADGKRDNIIEDILKGEADYSYFIPSKRLTDKRNWIAQAGSYAVANVIVNDGAKAALLSDTATSLLPVGLVRLEGEFKKGDIIRVCDEDLHELGIGLAEYSSVRAAELLGMKNQKALVHYDYLYIETHQLT